MLDAVALRRALNLRNSHAPSAAATTAATATPMPIPALAPEVSSLGCEEGAAELAPVDDDDDGDDDGGAEVLVVGDVDDLAVEVAVIGNCEVVKSFLPER
jgi:hypothetical protein